MRAINLKIPETLNALARAFDRFHDRFSQAGLDGISLILVPILLFSAYLASDISTSLAETAIVAACLIGSAMIFCAFRSMGILADRQRFLSFVIYGAGLAVIIILGQSNPALWMMAAAFPLEVWFVQRRIGPALTGTAFALGLLGLFAFKDAGSVSNSPISITIFALYTASLIFRSLILRDKTAKPDVVAPAPVRLSGDVSMVLDLEGFVQQIDETTATLLGAKPQSLEGSALLDRVHVTDRVSYLSLLADLRRNLPAQPVELRLRSIENGKTQFLSYHIEGERMGDAIMLLGRSLEREQALVREIESLRSELETERIGKGKLLETVSHELRTPLNAIIGFSDMLSDAQGAGLALEKEKQQEYAGLIRQSGHYLLELVNAVLDNSRLEDGSYRIDPVSFVFRDTVELCASVIMPQAQKKGIAFCHRVGASTGELVADRCAIKQILLNLATNAVKFTEPGGCVTLDASRVTVDGRAMLEVTVSDTGIGIAPDDLQRIGTPFVRGSNSYARAQEGSGLGLSLVKGLVELHQGCMQIKTSVSEGTIVTVRLPVDGPATIIDEHDNPLGKDLQQLGTVIEMHRPQGEWSNDWQKEEIRDEDNAQTRKTA